MTLVKLCVDENTTLVGGQMEGALYDVDAVRRCIVAGFFANAAYLHPSGVYRTVRNDHELHIHPSSVLYAEKPPAWYGLSSSFSAKKKFCSFFHRKFHKNFSFLLPGWSSMKFSRQIRSLCATSPSSSRSGSTSSHRRTTNTELHGKWRKSGQWKIRPPVIQQYVF